MAYQFTDMTQVGVLQMTSDNQLIYNGVNIDKTLTDAQCTVMTLNITGRATVDYNINTVSPEGRDGEMFQGATLKPRTLQVEILISATDNATLRKKYEQLNKILSLKEVVEIQFNDEMDRSYFGIYTGADNPKEDSNEQVFNIDIYCADPFKYGPIIAGAIQNGSVLNIQSDFPVRPAIGVAYGGTSSTLDIINTTTDKGFKLVDLHPSTEKVYRIDLPKEIITKGDDYQNGFKNLNITSDWEDFTVKTGDQIVVTPDPASVTMIYRGKYL